MYDQLFPESTEQAFSAKLLRPVEPQSPRFSTWGFLSAAPKGLTAGAAQGMASTADVGKAIADKLPANMEGPFGKIPIIAGIQSAFQVGADILNPKEGQFTSEVGTSLRNVARDYMPDPATTHASELVVADLFRVGGKAITAAVAMGNIPGAVAAGVEEGFTMSDELARQGVDVKTRTKVGTVNAALNAAAFALPVAGKTWAQTGALALTGGPVAFIGQNMATKKILEDADYTKQADQYDPFDPVGLTLSTLVPFGFGALAMRGRAKAKTTMTPEVEDAARVSLLRENVDGSNPAPGLDTADAHVAAYTKAMEQMAAGDRVDVASTLPESVGSRAGDGMAERVRIADPIERAPNLSEAQRQMEGDLADKVLNDYEVAKAEYATRPDSMGGKVLNTDIARELSPGYLKDRTQSAAVHEPASYFIKQLYAEKLKNVQDGEVVLFTSGGTGAGKTTGIRDVTSAQAIADQAAMIYDTNMNTLSSAVRKIEQALEAGANVQIIHVQRDPVDSLVNGALKRAARQEKEFGTGRTVPLSEHAKTHKGSAEVIPQLAEKYKDDPRVNVMVLDNTRGKGRTRLSDVAFVRNFDYNGLEGRLNEALKQQFDSGAISESVFRGTAESAVPDQIAVHRSDVPAQPEQQHPAGRPGTGAQEGSQAAGDYLNRETQRLAQEAPDTPVLLEGMDQPMPLTEVMAQIKQDLQADLADVPLLQVAAECFIQSGGGIA